MYNEREVANDLDKTFFAESDATITSNALSVTITGVAGKKHYLGSIVLTGTTGTGAAEALTIKDGATTVWTETFTVGTDKVRQFQAVPLVTSTGSDLVVTASATNLTGGKLFVVGYTK
jgi:hypothetical protein